MPGFIGFWELLALAAIMLLLFGPRRLPEVGRSLGRTIREFRTSARNAVPGLDELLDANDDDDSVGGGEPEADNHDMTHHHDEDDRLDVESGPAAA